MFQSPPTYIKLSYETYNHLLLENANLKRELCVKESSIHSLFLEVMNHTITIDVLKENITILESENEEMKRRLLALENENIELKKENVELKKEIHELKETIRELKETVRELKEENLYRKQKEYKQKIILTIQDLHEFYQLERNVLPLPNKIHKLRYYRNKYSHYILKDDDDDYIQYRKRHKIVEELRGLLEKEENITLREGIEKQVGKGTLEKIVLYVSGKMEEENLLYVREEEEDIEDVINEFWDWC